MYSVVWPRGRSTQSAGQYAPRLKTLESARIGFLWNYRYRGDEIFPVMEREIRQRFPGARFFDWELFGNIHGGDEHQVLDALPGKLREMEIKGVISGVGA